MSDPKPDLPSRLWLVAFWQGTGWPRCTGRTLVTRKYAAPQHARRMIETVRELPSHHVFVSVHSTRCYWEEVNADELPEPLTHDQPDEKEA